MNRISTFPAVLSPWTIIRAAVWLTIFAGIPVSWAGIILAMAGFYGPAAHALATAVLAGVTTLFLWAASRRAPA